MKALVGGGLGVIGRNMVNHLTNRDGWEVVALSRREPDFETPAQFISVELLNREDTEEKLQDLTDVCHIFYAALQAREDPAQEVGPNLEMLQNLATVVEPRSPGLGRVILNEGVKAYGVHLGPFKTPARESDARHMPPNFYYDQEDFLRSCQLRKGWTWTVLRPDVVCGFSLGSPMNLVMVIAVYAAVSKELGLPLRFPGKPGAYHALVQFTDAGLQARQWSGPRPQKDVLMRSSTSPTEISIDGHNFGRLSLTILGWR